MSLMSMRNMRELLNTGHSPLAFRLLFLCLSSHVSRATAAKPVSLNIELVVTTAAHRTLYTTRLTISAVAVAVAALLRERRLFVFNFHTPVPTWSSRSPRILSSTASFGSKLVLSCNQTGPGGHVGQSHDLATVDGAGTTPEREKNVVEINRVASWVLLWHREQAFHETGCRSERT